jgi:methionine synthase II (cobalamin-independent)
MSVAQHTGRAVGAHLVGGIRADNAEAAMRAVARTLGKHVYAITDGETGPRKAFIGWQIAKLAGIEGIRLVGTTTVFEDADNEVTEVPKLAIDTAVSALPRRVVGYADAAEASYEIFARLRAEGVIPKGVKFQVSLPTPLAPVVAFVTEEDQERFYPIYAAAMEIETAEIINAIPADDLMLQFDVAIEIAVLSGAQPATPRLRDKRFMLNEIRRILDRVPANVEHGLHLCYGDFGHAHFAVPQDLSLCVEFANALAGAFNFVHMPVDRDTGRNPGYHEPLRELKCDGRLALGVIDYRGDETRTKELVAAAARAGREFAVATECGMARIDEGAIPGPSLQRLLDLHAAVAEPIR